MEIADGWMVEIGNIMKAFLSIQEKGFKNVYKKNKDDVNYK